VLFIIFYLLFLILERVDFIWNDIIIGNPYVGGIVWGPGQVVLSHQTGSIPVPFSFLTASAFAPIVVKEGRSGTPNPINDHSELSKLC
jgi:hypothetical protein